MIRAKLKRSEARRQDEAIGSGAESDPIAKGRMTMAKTREQMIREAQKRDREYQRTRPETALDGYIAAECDGCGEFRVCYDPGAYAGGLVALCDDCMRPIRKTR